MDLVEEFVYRKKKKEDKYVGMVVEMKSLFGYFFVLKNKEIA